MKYVILIMNTPTQPSMETPEGQEWAKSINEWYEAWDHKLTSGGAALKGPSTAKTIRDSGVVDGPFIESKEVVGGFSILATDTIDEAVEIGGTWPGVDKGWITIEVRPVDPMM